MKIPFAEIAQILSARRDAGREADEVVRLSVMVALEGPVELGRAVREGLRPSRAGGRLHVEGFKVGSLPQVNALSDAAVILCAEAEGAPQAAASLWRAYAQAGVPCVVLGLFDAGADAAACEAQLVQGGVEEADLLLGLNPDDVVTALGGWLVERLPEGAAASAAANFPCCRRAMALALVRDACSSNAVVGLLGFVPGADLPVMTVTQLTLVVRIASIYGVPLDADRLREAAVVVASAFGMRGVARLLVRALPIPAFVVRAGVGAGGTYAVGCALASYFERLAGQGQPSQRTVSPTRPAALASCARPEDGAPAGTGPVAVAGEKRAMAGEGR